MSYMMYAPTRVLFGAGQLNHLHEQAMPGQKALLVISNGKSTRENGALDRTVEELSQAGVQSVLFDQVQANPLKSTIMAGARAARDNGCDFIVALGGGSVMDAAKIMAMMATNEGDLWDYVSGGTGKGQPVPNAPLPVVCITTTAGTGSEVTNISILALLSRRTKKGLAHESMFADQAVLIPELLKGLPFSVFATSSIDALIHAIESSLSPKASATTKLFGYQAIAWILKGYLAIRDQGPDARFPLLSQFLLASNYAGIAFGNAGCAAVHALSYPLGAVYHVPHGESNYAMFTGVMKQYLAIRSDGAIAELNAFLAQLLDCPPEAVYEALEDLLSCLLPKKALHEYGMQEHELAEFTDSVLANQQRLLQNNFVPLSREQIYAIYRSLY